MGVTWRRGQGWGRLPSSVTVLVLLALLCIIWSAPVLAQIEWESYQTVSRSTVWGTVANPYSATYNIAYMGGSGFVKNANYNIGYYDGNGDLVATDNGVKAAGGNLNSECNLNTDPNAAAGTWHSSAYEDPATPPATYDGSGVANDDFEVLAEAIPEFPTILSAIAVIALCCGVYFWMRRRMAHAKA